MVHDPKNIRNIILVSHSSAGKTMLAEALLYTAKAIPKMGSVDAGDTVSDYNPDEKERKTSINASILHCMADGVKVNVIDTPGFADFAGEVIAGFNAVEGAVLVVNATSGIEVGTNRSWKLIEKYRCPAAIFINKMDRENADFGKVFDAVKARFGKQCVLVGFPLGAGPQFAGTIDLLNPEAVNALSGEEKTKAQQALDALKEAVAETDDALLEKYLETGELSAEQMKAAFHAAVCSRKLVPVIAGSATTLKGVQELLNIVLFSFPSPADVPREAFKDDDGSPLTVAAQADAPFSAQVFKTIFDAYVGQINIFRVFSGTLKANTGFYNVSKKNREKLAGIALLQGKDQKPVDEVGPGDIACVVKLKDTATQDSLSEEKHPVRFAPIPFPEPALSFSIRPKSRGDEDKISSAIHRLLAEDLTFQANRDPQTKELVASGMGDLHLTIMINRLRSRFNVNVDVGTPKVAYRETISAKADAQYRHKKQSGGSGQFAEVWMRIAPLERGKGFEFIDDVVGGSIPSQFVVSCEKGVKSTMAEGVLAGYPVVDLQVSVYDGKTHPVDSNDISFQIAARHAFKESFLKARPVILEPIMEVDFVVPDEFMGDVTGSLNSRRGRILGMEPGTDGQTIKARMPLAEMYKYVNELKSITQGRATYTMTFSHYEEVPGNLAQAIIDQAKKEKEEARHE